MYTIRKVSVCCAAGGDTATGEGDHHLQAVLQELELKHFIGTFDKSCTQKEEAVYLKMDSI